MKICGIFYLTKSAAGDIIVNFAAGRCLRGVNKKAPPKGCPHKKGGNQILKIDRVGGESNPTESNTLEGQSTA